MALGEAGTLLGAAQMAGCCVDAGNDPPTLRDAATLPISTAPRDWVTDGLQRGTIHDTPALCFYFKQENGCVNIA